MLFFQRGQFRFILYHTQVISLKVVIGDVFPFHGQ